MSNNTAMTAKRPAFSAVINTVSYQKMITNVLKDPKKVERFVSNITTVVATNPAIAECEYSSIVSGALTAESLGLSLSPTLKQACLVPFDNKKKGCKEAQFQCMYVGFLQLAMRSGYYKYINVREILKGEMKKWNPLTEELVYEPIEDEDVRSKTQVVGYVARFEYLNGFRKTIYWSREKMINYADRYSKAFSKNATRGRNAKVSFEDYCAGNFPKDDAWKYSSPWYTDFDAMAFKTMLKQLIGKWGIMSIDIQTAFEQDTDFETENYTVDDADDSATPIVPEPVAPPALEEAEPEADAAIDDGGAQFGLDDL